MGTHGLGNGAERDGSRPPRWPTLAVRLILTSGGAIVEKFTAVFERHGKWWTGYVEELPGANTQGRTLPEARRNLKEAVRLVVDANRSLSRRDARGKEVLREELMVTLH